MDPILIRGLIDFKLPDGTLFSLPLLDADRVINEVAESIRRENETLLEDYQEGAPAPKGLKNHYDFLEVMRGRILEMAHVEPDVDPRALEGLTLSQVDDIVDAVGEEYLRKKSARKGRMERMLGSANSTASALSN